MCAFVFSVVCSGHVGDVVFVGSILYLYYCKNGDFPVRNCASILLIFLGRFEFVFVDVWCYNLVDDFFWCFVVAVCVDYVGVSLFEMVLDCASSVSYVL